MRRPYHRRPCELVPADSLDLDALAGSSTPATPTTSCRSGSIRPGSSSRSRSATSTSPRRASRSRTTSRPRSRSSPSAATRAGSAGWAPCPHADASGLGEAALRAVLDEARARGRRLGAPRGDRAERPRAQALREARLPGACATSASGSLDAAAPRITHGTQPADLERRARLDPPPTAGAGALAARRRDARSTCATARASTCRRSTVERDGETVGALVYRPTGAEGGRRAWRSSLPRDEQAAANLLVALAAHENGGFRLLNAPRRRAPVERLRASSAPAPTCASTRCASPSSRRGRSGRIVELPSIATASGVSTGEEGR